MRTTVIKGRMVFAACCLVPVAALTAACGTARPPATGTGTTTITITDTPSPPPGTPSPTPSAPAGPPQCATTALKLTVGMANGAAGTIYYALEFTNESGSTCTMYGYPGVAFVSAPHGSQIGAPASRDGSTPLATITLRPGATAHAALGVSDVLIGNNCQGHQVQVHWVQVYPPDQYAALYGPLNMLGCAKRSLVIMHVSTVSSGATGA